MSLDIIGRIVISTEVVVEHTNFNKEDKHE